MIYNYTGLKLDLQRCINFMSRDCIQSTPELERSMRFADNCETLNQCMDLVNKLKVDINYALHKWYYRNTSKVVSHLFCNHGATHTKSSNRLQDVDIFIGNIAFKVYLIDKPMLPEGVNFDLSTLSGKSEMITWLYNNNYIHDTTLNSIYVICDGADDWETLKLRSNFGKIEKKIKLYMDYISTHPFNTVNINNHEVLADLLWINDLPEPKPKRTKNK